MAKHRYTRNTDGFYGDAQYRREAEGRRFDDPETESDRGANDEGWTY